MNVVTHIVPISRPSNIWHVSISPLVPFSLLLAGWISGLDFRIEQLLSRSTSPTSLPGRRPGLVHSGSEEEICPVTLGIDWCNQRSHPAEGCWEEGVEVEGMVADGRTAVKN